MHGRRSGSRPRRPTRQLGPSNCAPFVRRNSRLSGFVTDRLGNYSRRRPLAHDRRYVATISKSNPLIRHPRPPLAHNLEYFPTLSRRLRRCYGAESLIIGNDPLGDHRDVPRAHPRPRGRHAVYSGSAFIVILSVLSMISVTGNSLTCRLVALPRDVAWTWVYSHAPKIKAQSPQQIQPLWKGTP
jgi:hypothetical protein